MKFWIIAILLIFNDVFINLYEENILPIPSVPIIFSTLILFRYKRFNFKIKKVILFLLVWTLIIFLSMMLNVANWKFFFHFLVYVFFFLILKNSGQFSIILEKFSKLMIIYSLVYIFIFFLFTLGININLPTFKYYESGRFIFLFNEPLNAGLGLLTSLYFSIKNHNKIQIFLFFSTIVLVKSFTFQLLSIILILSNLNILVGLGAKRKLKFFILGILTTFFIFIYYYERAVKVFSFSEGSTRIRLAQLLRDFDILKENFFLGIGHGNAALKTAEFSNQFTNSLKYYELTYTNTFFEILTGSGIIGFIFAFLFFKSVTNKNNMIGLIFFLLFLTNGFFLYPMLWFLILFIHEESYNNRLFRKSTRI